MQVRSIGFSALSPYAPARAAAPVAVSDQPCETLELSSGSPARPTVGGSLLQEAFRTAAQASAQFAFGPVAQLACRTLKGHLRTGPAAVPANELGPLPPSAIQRPVLFVPGFHTPMHRFEPLAEKLTESGRNGGQPFFVREGRFYSDRECSQPAHPGPEARVFVTMFTRPNLPPPEGSGELRANLRAIEKLTGSPKTDVAAFSMGGLTARRYLDEGGDGIGKLQLVGTPNRGSSLARMSLHLLDGHEGGYDVDLLLSIKNLSSADRGALEWLEPGSPALAAMNDNWARQKERLESVRHFGSDQKITVGNRSLLHATRGDGIVARESLQLEGMTMRYLADRKYALHGNLITSPELYDELQDHFGWR